MHEPELWVRGSSGRTDTDIARAVRQALEWDVFVPEARIRSTVSDSWVTLEGDVDYWSQREDAERAIRNLNGVCGVLSNEIEIKASDGDDLRRAEVDRGRAGTASGT